MLKVPGSSPSDRPCKARPEVRDCARLVKTIAMNDDRSAGFGDQNYFLAVPRSRGMVFLRTTRPSLSENIFCSTG